MRFSLVRNNSISVRIFPSFTLLLIKLVKFDGFNKKLNLLSSLILISLSDKNTEIIDLDGKTMIPGFIEGHAHIMGTGYNQKNIDLLIIGKISYILLILMEL